MKPLMAIVLLFCASLGAVLVERGVSDGIYLLGGDDELELEPSNSSNQLLARGQTAERNLYPPTEDGGWDVPSRPIWRHKCRKKHILNQPDYNKAITHMRWFCKQRVFTKKTTIYIAVAGESVVYVCSKWGAANPCNKYEWDWAEKALDGKCGKGIEGWVKLKGWPRIFGRSTFNQTICPTVTRNLWSDGDYRIKSKDVWINGTMLDRWNDEH